MREGVSSPSRLDDVVAVPGDKSISHRAALLNSISHGTAHVTNFCMGDDRTSMLRCLRGLGVRITRHSNCAVSGLKECFQIIGRGLEGLSEPSSVLNAGNSGTTIRLISGLLAAQPFLSVISGDRSLRKRPMSRIVHPLVEMGAMVMGRSGNSLAPLAIRGGGLKGIDYALPFASAQLKSCILIAGIHAHGETVLRQHVGSRDHTERMMTAMGASLSVDGLDVTVSRSDLSSINVRVPGDISAAAFWLVAGSCHPDARIRIDGVGINPSRTGVLEILRSMGARISVENAREEGGEPSADLVVETSHLEGAMIRGEIIPSVIDELPVLALAACFAKGKTVIADAQELRVKESDRIRATVDGLRALGAQIEEMSDGMVIHGGGPLVGGICKSFGDHRIAMTMGIAGLLAQGNTIVVGSDAADVSYPGFWQALRTLQKPRKWS